MNQRYFLLAAVATCSVAGFVIGRISSQSSNPESGAYVGGDASRPMAGPRVAGDKRHPGSTKSRAGGLLHSSKQPHPSYASSRMPLPARVSSITKHPNPLERSRLWVEFIDGLGPSEIKQVLDASIRGERSSLNAEQYQMLLMAWVDQDPYAALDHVEKVAPWGFHQTSMMTAWAMKDPASALRWAEQNQREEGSDPLLLGVIQGMAFSDPQGATQLLGKISNDEQRKTALYGILDQFTQQQPDAARNWALSLEEDGLRSDAIVGVARNLAMVDPKGAADWLLSIPGEASTRAMDRVMESMTLADSNAAIHYMENISDPVVKSRALEGIANELSTIDPKTTLALIDANPDLVNDAIVRELVWGARAKEPVLGADAIIRIEDERTRNRTYQRYISRWLSSDYNAAVDWVNRNELPAEANRLVERMIEVRRERQK